MPFLDGEQYTPGSPYEGEESEEEESDPAVPFKHGLLARPLAILRWPGSKLVHSSQLKTEPLDPQAWNTKTLHLKKTMECCQWWVRAKMLARRWTWMKPPPSRQPSTTRGGPQPE